jgi:glycosyltransferase involved in cell wall biosynthesis
VRIVHIEAGRHLYGGARQVVYLVEELARRGVDNVLVCAPGAAVAAAVRSRGVVELPMAGELDLGMISRLRKRLAELEPDLVHVHSRRGADLHAGLAAAGRWPAVVTRRVDSAEWAPWARLKYSRYAAVVAISRAVERMLLDAGVGPERVHRVPSGVDLERFPADARARAEARARLLRAFSLPEEAFVAGVVAQLIPRKGHMRLLDILPGLVARDPRLVVICFGRGPLMARLASEIEARDLGAHVVLAGFREDLPALLPGLDALLHPASAEGLGVAVLEALAAGVPVVASAVGGILDVIEPDVHGLLVPPEDMGAWARAVERLMTDSAERSRLAAAGRERVAAAFSVRRMAEGNLAVYEAVLRGSTARRRRAIV